MSEDYKQRGKTVSKTSVRNYVRGTYWGRVARRLKHKPLLSKKNIKDRLNFALFVQSEGFCEENRFGRRLRENIIFTDESPIELIPTPNKQNTRIRTSNESLLNFGKPKKSLKIMVAGGITAQGVTELHVLEKGKTIDGRYYEEKILPIYLKALNNPLLVPNKSLATLQQDSAPGHCKKSVIEKIESSFPNYWTKGIWSGNSPDLNVIEHVWSILQDSVFENPKPKNREELIERVQTKWHSLKPDYLANLVHSFPKRIEQVLNNQGGPTDY